jgi:large subunit ribosomal protein L24
MPKMNLKRGDSVLVIAGKHKGSVGTLLRVFPKTNSVVVSGINLSVSKKKPSVEVPLDRSKVMFYDAVLSKPAKISYVKDSAGKYVRFAKKLAKEV